MGWGDQFFLSLIAILFPWYFQFIIVYIPALVFFLNKMRILLFLLCLLSIYVQACTPQDTVHCATCSTPTVCTSCKANAVNKYLNAGACTDVCPAWTDLTKRVCIAGKNDCGAGYIIDDDKKTCEDFGGYLFSGIAIILALLTLI